MAEAGLGALVEGFTEARDQQMKKAKQIADEQSRKFEQQFRLDQAKQQSAVEERRLGLEKERVAIEKMAAQANEKYKEDQARIAEERVQVQRYSAEMRTQIARGKLSWDNLKDREKFFQDTKAGIRKSNPTWSEDQINQVAQQAMSDAMGALVNPQSYPGQGQQQPQPQQQGLSPQILQALHGAAGMVGGNPPPVPQQAPQMAPQGQQGAMQQQPQVPGLTVGITPPSERPDIMSQPNVTGTAKLENIKANTRRADANAAFYRQEEKYLAERTGLTKEEAKKVIQQTKDLAQHYKYGEQILKGQILKLRKESDNLDSQITKRTQETRKLKDEIAAEESGEATSDQVKDLQKQEAGYVTEHEKLTKDAHQALGIVLLHKNNVLNEGAVNPATKRPYTDAEKATESAEMESAEDVFHNIRTHEVEVGVNLAEVQLQLAKSKKHYPTGPDGQIDAKKRDAAIAAAETKLRTAEADRENVKKAREEYQERVALEKAGQHPHAAPQQAPETRITPFIPGSSSIPQGAGGDLVRRSHELSRQHQAHHTGTNKTAKKPIKKSVRERKSSDLWKALGSH